MADVRPFRALRYSPRVDIAAALCPPFDTISPQEQRELHQRSPHNAVRLELALDDGDRYQRAAETLRRWLAEGVLLRDGAPAFYLHRQEFPHGNRRHRRLALFARLRLEPWERGAVRPHEETFGAPKEDRLHLLRALRLNTSPVFLIYRDAHGRIAPLLAEAAAGPPALEFADPQGQGHALWRLDDPGLMVALRRAFADETLYVADGHHRYETALAYRDEVRAAAPDWSDERPENFALVALTAADDPGLLVLPIHRLINADVPLEELFRRLLDLFEMETAASPQALLSTLESRGKMVPVFGLAAAEASDLYLLSLYRPEAVEHLLPRGRSPAWRRLDAAIATYAVLRHGFGLREEELSRPEVLSYTEDAGQALEAARSGRFRYALLLNPVAPRTIMALADAGERMPQKSTFFHPKLPTGLLFNPLDD